MVDLFNISSPVEFLKARHDMPISKIYMLTTSRMRTTALLFGRLLVSFLSRKRMQAVKGILAGIVLRAATAALFAEKHFHLLTSYPLV